MKKTHQGCDLNSCFLCRGCLKDWLGALESHRESWVYKKGESVFEEGQPVRGIYFIYKGRVKVHKNWGDSKPWILHFAREGDMIGYRGLGPERIYPISATTLTEAHLCFIDTSFFESTLQVNHALTYSLMEFYASQLQAAEKRMANLVHMEVKGRVAETLLMLNAEFGQSGGGVINITLTKQDLASYAGTTYETFSRMLNELVKDQIVQVSGKTIEILSVPKLEKLLH
ncbi:MAG: Crp/Fnr family transcriptional regulator [Bacteroidota bacterium]|nr:Crp/Fnr family transcriptional regulator [Bacteroidota bacterium]